MLLLLHNEDQQYNSPHASFAIYFCRERSGHAWTTSSSLHCTRTV